MLTICDAMKKILSTLLCLLLSSCTLATGVNQPTEARKAAKEPHTGKTLTAVQNYLLLARQGDVKAQCLLGSIYTAALNYKEALKWYGMAAKQGDPGAQYHLGIMYIEGKGVKKDRKKAFNWFLKSAEQGNSPAQVNLGFIYIDSKDYKKAYFWYLKAAEQGDSGAPYFLGSMYEHGWGVLQDYVTAYAWYNVSASNGYPWAPDARDGIRKRMTPDQIGEGQALSKKIYNGIYHKRNTPTDKSPKALKKGQLTNNKNTILHPKHAVA